MTSAHNSKKYFTFTPRLIIYSSLIIITFIFLYLSSIYFDKYSWWQDFWVNLSAGSVSTLITVTIVDYFINIEKNLKLKAFSNAELSSRQIESCANLNLGAKKLLDSVMDKSYLSARGYFRILKVARTIADMEESEIVTPEFLSEAFSYRSRVS